MILRATYKQVPPEGSCACKKISMIRHHTLRFQFSIRYVQIASVYLWLTSHWSARCIFEAEVKLQQQEHYDSLDLELRVSHSGARTETLTSINS